MEDLFIFDLGTLLIVALGIYIMYWLRRRDEKPRRKDVPPPVMLTVTFNDRNNRWEVQDASGGLAGRVRVKQGQTIMWKIVNAKARFDFSTVLFCSVETVTLSEPLTLTVAPNTPPGRYVYAVEIDGQCAVGGTPPEMEVEEW